MPVSGLCGPVIVQMKYFSPKDMPQTIRGKVFPRPSDSVLNSLRFCFSFQGGKKRRKEGKHMQPISELASICVALSCSRRSDGCLFLQLPYLSGMIASFFFSPPIALMFSMSPAKNQTRESLSFHIQTNNPSIAQVRWTARKSFATNWKWETFL